MLTGSLFITLLMRLFSETQSKKIKDMVLELVMPPRHDLLEIISSKVTIPMGSVYIEGGDAFSG